MTPSAGIRFTRTAANRAGLFTGFAVALTAACLRRQVESRLAFTPKRSAISLTDAPVTKLAATAS
jgi:hypothetical protein